MKNLKILVLPLLTLLVLSSCTSVRVVADYDKNANFNEYKTYAFYKTGIDKAQISDLDKKRILHAIDDEICPWEDWNAVQAEYKYNMDELGTDPTKFTDVFLIPMEMVYRIMQ